MQYDSRSTAWTLSFTTGALLAGALGCGPAQPAVTPSLTPAALAAALTAACPPTAADDRDARDACADALATSPALQGSLSAPFFWGGQRAGTGADFLRSDRTELEPLVWKRLYLSTFMFPGGHSVEQAGDTTVVRIPVLFRGGLDPGDFPYPFWHSRDKWDSYQTAREILLYMRDGRVIGGLRSAERDPTLPRAERPWDGKWQWNSGRGDEPRVTLFRYLLSPENPRVGDLDRAYRTLEREMRQESCLACHTPDNPTKMNPLELLSYPNQALSARHMIIDALRAGTMPPDGEGAKPRGRGDTLLDAALEFAAVADEALRFEEQPAALRARTR